MKRSLKWMLTLAVMAFMCTGAIGAEERGTPADAKKMVDEALAHIKQVGPEKAFEDFSTPGGKWHYKDIYLFCYKTDGTNVCHGANKALIGKNLIELKTADGQLLIKNLVNIATTKGSGWIDYQWPHPETKKTEAKKAYVAKIPGFDGLVGAGSYPK